MCNFHSIYILIVKCEWLIVSSRLHTAPTPARGDPGLNWRQLVRTFCSILRSRDQESLQMPECVLTYCHYQSNTQLNGYY